MIIVVDLCGVLRDTAQSALFWIKKKYGVQIARREWKKWDPMFACNISGAEAAYAVTEDPLWIGGIPLIKYAPSATREISEMGHKIVIGTCAPASTAGMIETWLAKHKITYDELRFFATPRDKAAFPADVLVDDHHEAIYHFGGSVGILFNQPWNQRKPVVACFTIDAPMAQREVEAVLRDGGTIRAIGWKHVVRIIAKMTALRGESQQPEMPLEEMHSA